MDTREAINLENRILAQAKKLINAKFQTGNEELSTDSKLAVQQLATAVSSIRDEVRKTESSFRVISVTVDDINQRIGTLGTELKDSRIIKDITDLKLGVDKLWDHILATDITNRFNVLEKASSDLVNRVGTLERLGHGVAKRGPVVDSQPAAVVDNSAIKDIESKLSETMKHCQEVKKDVETINKQLSTLVNVPVVVGPSTDDINALKERIITLELTIASLTNAMIDSEATRNLVQKAEIDLLKARLDHADKKIADFDLKFKHPAVSGTASPMPAAGSPMYDPQINVPSPIPVQEPVKVAVNQPAAVAQAATAAEAHSTTPPPTSAFSPFAFKFNA